MSIGEGGSGQVNDSAKLPRIIGSCPSSAEYAPTAAQPAQADKASLQQQQQSSANSSLTKDGLSRQLQHFVEP